MQNNINTKNNDNKNLKEMKKNGIVINCFDISNITNEDYQIFYSYATEERKKRADRYRQLEDSKRCILAEALLRYSFSEFLKQEKGMEIDLGYVFCNSYLDKREKTDTVTKNIIVKDTIIKNSYYLHDSFHIVYPKCGKPYIQNVDNFFFNLSHSGKWVVVAYGDSEVGVDVEKIRQKSTYKNITNRFFTEEERKYIYSVNEEAEERKRFTRIWTLKESYIKYLGIGLKKDLCSFSLNVENEKEAIVCDVHNKIASDLKLNSYLLGEEYVLSICS